MLLSGHAVRDHWVMVAPAAVIGGTGGFELVGSLASPQKLDQNKAYPASRAIPSISSTLAEPL